MLGQITQIKGFGLKQLIMVKGQSKLTQILLKPTIILPRFTSILIGIIERQESGGNI